MTNLILKPLVSVLTSKCYKPFRIGSFDKKTDGLPPELPPVPIPPGGFSQ